MGILGGFGGICGGGIRSYERVKWGGIEGNGKNLKCGKGKKITVGKRGGRHGEN